MIEIEESNTADTRSCDFSNVSKEQLIESSVQHILDVKRGMDFFKEMIDLSAVLHDHDKLSRIDHFHGDFISGFKKTGWWDNHRKANRHHLLEADGIPESVNLIDVLDMIVDCVMAGMGRTGKVYPLKLDGKVLMDAFNNTVDLLKSQVVVKK